MRNAQIEHLVLDVIDRVNNGASNEDNRVELKAQWPDPDHKTARKIAALCNSSRGDEVFWIVGLDEDKGVVGASDKELSEWWPQIARCFDENISPSIQHLVVPDGSGGHVVALVFGSERAPFVVKTPDGKGPNREVPWREATSTRTAHRSDLIRLLVPKLYTPQVEMLSVSGSLRKSRDPSRPSVELTVSANLFFAVTGEQLLVFPFHRSESKLEFVEEIPPADTYSASLAPPRRRKPGPISGMMDSSNSYVDSHTIAGTSTELVVSGSGMVNLEATFVWQEIMAFEAPPRGIEFVFQFPSAQSEVAAVCEGKLTLQHDLWDQERATYVSA